MSKRDEFQQQYVNLIRRGKAADLLTEVRAASLPRNTDEGDRLRREWLLARRRGGLRLVEGARGVAGLCLFCDACGERIRYTDWDSAAVVGRPDWDSAAVSGHPGPGIPFFAHASDDGNCLDVVFTVLYGCPHGPADELDLAMKNFIRNLGITDLDAVGDPLEDTL